MAVVEHGIAGILPDQLGGALLELRAIVGRPPVAQVSIAVELPAGIVEAVADLVADHRADAAVVHGVGSAVMS